MQQTSDPRQPITSSPGRGLIQRLFWGKLSRPLFLLLLLLLGSATALALALTGNVSAHWFALGFALAAIAVLAVLIHRMRRRLRFVRHLRDWAERMRGGDLSTKVPFSAETDLDEVIEDINSLGGMLEKLAHEMDAQSHAQTVRLARKTQSLDILMKSPSASRAPATSTSNWKAFSIPSSSSWMRAPRPCTCWETMARCNSSPVAASMPPPAARVTRLSRTARTAAGP